MKFPAGVFRIRSAANNRALIDHSTYLTSRWKRHKMELKFVTTEITRCNNTGPKREECFVFEVLSEWKAKDNAAIAPRMELTPLK